MSKEVAEILEETCLQVILKKIDDDVHLTVAGC